MNYALTIRNLYSTLEAPGLVAHINNPLLLQELIEKLPAQSKLNWAKYANEQNANIRTFSKWLFNIAQAVSSCDKVHVHNVAPVGPMSNL